MAAAALTARTSRASAGDASFVAAGTLPIYRLLAIETLTVVALVRWLALDYDGSDINAVLLILVGIVTAAMLLRRYRLSTLAATLEGSALVFAASILVGSLSLALATAALPYRDGVLAAVDTVLMPVNAWPRMARALAHAPQLVGLMCRAYGTLLWQPFVLVALLALAGREAAVWRFVHAWCLTLVACLVGFALVPAIAAYRHYGIDPAIIDGLTNRTGWQSARVLASIRSGALHEISSRSMTGLITFPSFHAAGAVLLAWGYRRVPIVGWGFVALDGAMLLTVPLIGGHYFVDVLAGIAIAVTALIVARPRPRAQ